MYGTRDADAGVDCETGPGESTQGQKNYTADRILQPKPYVEKDGFKSRLRITMAYQISKNPFPLFHISSLCQLEKSGAGLKKTYSEPDMTPYELYTKTNPQVVITGAPPKGLAEAVRTHHQNIKDHGVLGRFRVPLWVCQGGFAGDNVVPEKDRLPKFAGKVTCPTYNLGGAGVDADFLFSKVTLNELPRIRLVSKNVCHRLVYDKKLHEYLKPHVRDSRSLGFIWEVMEAYLRCSLGCDENYIYKQYLGNIRQERSFTIL